MFDNKTLYESSLDDKIKTPRKLIFTHFTMNQIEEAAYLTIRCHGHLVKKSQHKIQYLITLIPLRYYQI